MSTSTTSIPTPSLRLTKLAAAVAGVFFLPAVGFSPGPGSSLGMPWEVFFCTWGMMLVASFISFAGYFACKRRGEAISVFYAICPALLFIAFVVEWNLREIAHYFAS